MFLNFDKFNYESIHKAFYLNNFNKKNEYVDENDENEEELEFDNFCLPFSGNNLLNFKLK